MFSASATQVRSLSYDDLRRHVQGMARAMRQAGICPPYVIGVLNGGLHPSRLLVESLGCGSELLLYRIQRPSSGIGKSALVRAVRRLPRAWVDAARIAESALREVVQRLRRAERGSPEEVDPAAVAFFREHLHLDRISASQPVVIMDDAIDTGETVARLILAISSAGVVRDAIRTAAVVQTLREPVITPDYCALRQVLVRWPWADDA